MKKITGLLENRQQHWVGDGFPVRTLFSYGQHGRQTSPFLLFDYAGPARFEPSAQPRGVGQHPHRGFETVTIVYEGEVSHRDSTGKGGTIGPGDVQWMTAASGILHEEFHSPAFTASGGNFRVVQLWVNLPAKAQDDSAGLSGDHRCRHSGGGDSGRQGARDRRRFCRDQRPGQKLHADQSVGRQAGERRIAAAGPAGRP